MAELRPGVKRREQQQQQQQQQQQTQKEKTEFSRLTQRLMTRK